MDYSATIHDQDDPAGQSVWGSTSPGSSPQRNRAGIDASLGSDIQSPFQPYSRDQTSNGLDQDDVLARPGTRRQDTGAAEDETTEGISEPQEEPSERSVFPSPSEPAQENQPPSRQELQSAPAQKTPALGPQLNRPQQSQFKLQAKITGLERTGKKDPILRFDVHTSLPRFRTTQYRDVRRLHSEFVKLAEHLISANPDSIVHAVPPSLTSAGAGTEEDELRVKALMQRWFNHVCVNETLMRDEEMVLFVESDFGYSPVLKIKQPATGVRRKILKQFAPPPDDTPELEQARPTVKLFYLGSMDAGHKVDKLVKTRRGLGLAENDFGVKLGAMHVQEPHPGLANAYKKLGKAVQAVGDSHAAQATAEATTLGDPFQYHSSDAFVVKETLTNRQILIREFLQAQEATRSKLNAADRLKASSNVRREKVDEALQSLEEARHTETHLQQKTSRVTQNLVRERRKWFDQTANDLRLSIREFACREIEAERRVLSMLESVRPDIRSIDASGGLSRLGREAHPTTTRRSNLAASQGPKGDAWSGVPRRADGSRAATTGILGSPVTEEAPGMEGLESGSGGQGRAGGSGGLGSLGGAQEEDDEDRVDARNAASRLATSTF